jgi:predicted dehydrogenase
MANSMPEARRMVAASEKSGKLYMVSQSRRWYPQHQQLRDTIALGDIGPVTTLNCDYYMGVHIGGFREQMDNPLVLDMAIHHFDLARYFTGADPLAVYAVQFNPQGSWYKGDASANCIFEMSNGIIFNYRGSWVSEGCHTSWNGDWRVAGSTGTLLCEKDAAPTGQIIASNTGFHRELKPASIAPVSLKHETMHGALREMLAYLRSGEKPQTECHDNIKSLAMVFAAIDSARQHQRIEINL